MVAVAWALGSAPAAGRTAPPGELARRVLDDARYQRTRPAAEPAAPAERGAPRREVRAGGAAAEALAPAAVGLGAAGLLVAAVAGLGVLVLLAALVVRGRSRAPAAAAAPPRGPEPDAPAGPLPDPATLAAAGRYGEAVHALLLAAVRHLERRLHPPPPPSRTGRELVALLPLPPDSRPAFAELVRQSERFTFGGAEIAREEFERSAALFRTLTGRSA